MLGLLPMQDEIKSDRLLRFLPLLLVGLTVAALGRVVGGEFTFFDDVYTVVRDPGLNPPTWSALGRRWKSAEMDIYMPLTQTVWAAVAVVARLPVADEAGVRLNPYLFHAVNLLVHLVSVLLVYSLLRQLVGNPVAAAAGAAIFAVHPLQVESVAWISGLKDVLCGMFCLAALRVWIAPTRRPVAAAGLFLLALLAKPSAVALPVMAAGIGIFAMSWGVRTTIVRLLPWIVLAIPFAVIAARAQPAVDVNAAAHVRPIVAADAIVFYLHKILWPGAMGIDYGRTPAVVLGMNQWGACAVVVVLMTVGFLARRRFPIFVAAGVVFVGALIPVLGLARFDFQRFSTVADHYLYLAMLGPAMAGAWVVWRYRLALPVMSLVIAVLSVVSFRQSGYWKNSDTLFEHAVAVNPESWMAHDSLGQSLLAEDQSAAGIVELRKAIEINPDEFGIRRRLGAALDRSGDLAGGIEQYQLYLSRNPEDAQVQCDLAAALADMGNLAAAITHYRSALRIDPNLSAAQQGLARALRQMNGGANGR